MDWERYIDRYAQYINDKRVKLFFELDIDPIVGYDRVKTYRKMLEKRVNAQCIPVWHKSRGKDEFVRMCKEYEYVAIGGIVSKEISRTEYRYFPWFIDTAHRNGARIHGLGFTSLSLLPQYHFDSVDSTTWIVGNRFANVLKFDGKTITQHHAPPGLRAKDINEVMLHNFQEWVRFQKWAKTNL